MSVVPPIYICIKKGLNALFFDNLETKSHVLFCYIPVCWLTLYYSSQSQ